MTCHSSNVQQVRRGPRQAGTDSGQHLKESNPPLTNSLNRDVTPAILMPKCKFLLQKLILPLQGLLLFDF